MRTHFALLAGLALSWAAALPARADEAEITLKPGNGVEIVASNCAACHSLDYIQMNAPYLTADAWKAEVTKMRRAFGANLDDDTAAQIAAYLAKQYGPAT